MSSTRSYLLEKPTGIAGNMQRVSNGLWCAGDHAFSLPVLPFPEGPTEIYGNYYDGGVTSTLNMIDARQSVVEIARTQIRPDLPAEEVLPGVAANLEDTRRLIPSLSFEWIQQKGRTQIQTINPMPDYTGRDDIMFLASSQGSSNHKDGCRVDRHLVGAGYYFQIIAVAYQPEAPSAPKPERDSCAIALELAAWTAENICLGAGCCRATAPDASSAAEAM